MRGDLINSHFKDDNKKSSYPCNGIVKSVDISTGNINITFENDIGQSNVPGYYIIESYSIEVEAGTIRRWNASMEEGSERSWKKRKIHFLFGLI